MTGPTPGLDAVIIYRVANYPYLCNNKIGKAFFGPADPAKKRE